MHAALKKFGVHIGKSHGTNEIDEVIQYWLLPSG
jgi:hypothetical protein